VNDNINNEKEMNNKGANKISINYDNTNDIPSDNGLIISKNENNQQQVDLFEEEPVLRTQRRKLKNTSSNDDKNSSKESKLLSESQNKEIIKNNEQPIEVKESKEEEKKEAYEDGEKIRKKIRLMDRLNKARARSCGKNDEKAKKSNDILIKAKLLESVLGHLKKPEDLNNNNNNGIEKENIKNDNINRDHSCDMHIIQKKKKKKNNIPFDG